MFCCWFSDFYYVALRTVMLLFGQSTNLHLLLGCWRDTKARLQVLPGHHIKEIRFIFSFLSQYFFFFSIIYYMTMTWHHFILGFSRNPPVEDIDFFLTGFPVKFTVTPWKSIFFSIFGLLPWNSNDFYSTPWKFPLTSSTGRHNFFLEKPLIFTRLNQTSSADPEG